MSAPTILKLSWEGDVHAVRLQFLDTSNANAVTGFKLYRSTNFGSFSMIQTVSSFVPKQWTYCTDSSVSSNTWYKYYVAAYNSQQELKSGADSIFTVDLDALAKSLSSSGIMESKISDFPVNFKGWSMKYGDTIVLNETNSPDSTAFTIIDVSNPASPRFAGQGKSEAATLGSACLSRNNQCEQYGNLPDNRPCFS
jgi:hypothetical protein